MSKWTPSCWGCCGTQRHCAGRGRGRLWGELTSLVMTRMLTTFLSPAARMAGISGVRLAVIPNETHLKDMLDRWDEDAAGMTSFRHPGQWVVAGSFAVLPVAGGGVEIFLPSPWCWCFCGWELMDWGLCVWWERQPRSASSSASALLFPSIISLHLFASLPFSSSTSIYVLWYVSLFISHFSHWIYGRPTCVFHASLYPIVGVLICRTFVRVACPHIILHFLEWSEPWWACTSVVYIPPPLCHGRPICTYIVCFPECPRTGLPLYFKDIF